MKPAASRALWPMVAVALLVGPVAAPGPDAAALAQRPASRADQYDKIVATTREQFYDPKMRGLDWSAEAARYRAPALAASDATSFQRVVNQLLGTLGTSHTGYYTDADMEYYVLQSVFAQDLKGFAMEHIGIMGDAEGAGLRVRSVLEGGPAARAGIRGGDLLTVPGGAPFRTVGTFRGRAGEPVALHVVRADSETDVSVTPAKENPLRAFLDATRRSVRTIEASGKRLGYVHLWTMTHPAFRAALEDAVGETLAGTDGLILDIRGGFGGNPMGFADIFFRPQIRWESRTRKHGQQDSTLGYAKPVVVLIDGGTRSAKEFFAYEMKSSHRAVLVGTRTAGAFLGANGFAIPPDGFLELPVEALKVDGQPLENVGVTPDVPAAELGSYGPSDPQLRTGIETLLGLLGQSPRSRLQPAGLSLTKKPTPVYTYGG